MLQCCAKSVMILSAMPPGERPRREDAASTACEHVVDSPERIFFFLYAGDTLDFYFLPAREDILRCCHAARPLLYCLLCC